MLCTVVRWQLSAELDRERPRGALVRGHLSRCPQCSAHATRLHALHGALIASAIAAPTPRAAPARQRARPLALLGAAAVLATTIALVVRPASPPPPPAAAALEPSPPVPRRALARELAGVAGALLDVDPLRDELTALRADALHGAAVALRLGRLR